MASPSSVSASPEPVGADKAFVFGSTMQSRPAARASVDVSVSGADVTVGELGADTGATPSGPVNANWRVADAGIDGIAKKMGERVGKSSELNFNGFCMFDDLFSTSFS